MRIIGYEANEFKLLEGHRYACFQNSYRDDLEKFTKLGATFRKLSKEHTKIRKYKEKFDLEEYLVWLEKNLHHLKYDTTLHFHYMRNIRK